MAILSPKTAIEQRSSQVNIETPKLNFPIVGTKKAAPSYFLPFKQYLTFVAFKFENIKVYLSDKKSMANFGRMKGRLIEM